MNSDRRIEDVRKYAEDGHSFSFIAKKLGLHNYQLKRLLNECGAGGIPFVNGYHSLARKNALAQTHASRRGRSFNLIQTPEMRAGLVRARAVLRERAIRTAFGVFGTIKELIKHFGLNICYETVRRRLKRGMTVEESLSTECDVSRLGERVTVLPITQKEINLARSYATHGHSLHFTAQLLGISDKRLARLIGGTDIQFVKGNQSLAAKKAHAEKRGQPRRGSRVLSEESIAKMARGGRLGLQKRYDKHTAFGVTGFVSELVEHFGCPVSAHSVSRRLRRGMNIEEALTTEPILPKRGVFPPQFREWLETCRRRTSKRILDAIARRLTPTMLRYRQPNYNIVVSQSKNPWISVDVQTGEGYLLHRLTFIKSFEESGVLFAFTQGKRGHLDFIAFEPDSEALARAIGDAK